MDRNNEQQVRNNLDKLYIIILTVIIISMVSKYSQRPKVPMITNVVGEHKFENKLANKVSNSTLQHVIVLIENRFNSGLSNKLMFIYNYCNYYNLTLAVNAFFLAVIYITFIL